MAAIVLTLAAMAALTTTSCKKGGGGGGGEEEEPVRNILQNITDPVFRAWCEEQMDEWDTDDNGKLSPDEAADVTEIVCSGTYNANKGIESLKGIEHFTGLTTLDCSYNKLSSFDVSKNSALTELYCTGNLLTALDVSKNIALTNLNCTNNPGDGESQFPVKVWPEFTTPPVNFTTTPWNYGGKTITPAYSK